jgi:hypothetical protein
MQIVFYILECLSCRSITVQLNKDIKITTNKGWYYLVRVWSHYEMIFDHRCVNRTGTCFFTLVLPHSIIARNDRICYAVCVLRLRVVLRIYVSHAFLLRHVRVFLENLVTDLIFSLGQYFHPISIAQNHADRNWWSWLGFLEHGELWVVSCWYFALFVTFEWYLLASMPAGPESTVFR